VEEETLIKYDMKEKKPSTKALFVVYCAIVDTILKEYRSGGYNELIEKHRKEH